MVYSQSLYTTVWQKSKATNNYPSYLDTSGSLTRGFGYGLIGTNQRLFIATRQPTHNIIVVNANNGDSVRILDMTGVSGGTYNLNDAKVSTNGIIFGCNLTINTSTSAFKVYRWDSESAVPTNPISFTTPAGTTFRLGDRIQITGSTADNSIKIWCAASANDTIVVFSTTDNGVTFTPTYIGLSNGATGTFPCVAPEGNGITSFWLKAAGKPIYKYSTTGQLMDSVSTGLVASAATGIYYFQVGANKFLGVYNYGFANGNENLRLLDVSLGGVKARLVFVTSQLGYTANANGSGDVYARVNTDQTVDLFLLGTNNGIADYKTRNLSGLSPFTAAIDGLNEFTLGCNFMESREFGKLYFAYDNTYLYFGFEHSPVHLDSLDIRVWIDNNPSVNNGASTAPFGAPTFNSTNYKPNYVLFLENGFYYEMRRWNGTSWSSNMQFQNTESYGGWSGNGYFSEFRLRRDSLVNPISLAFAVTLEKEANDTLYAAIPTNNPSLSYPNVSYFYVIPNFNAGSCVRMYNTGQVPVELTSFTATSFGNQVTLNWVTATETNNNGFEIQRSKDGINFTGISFVKGYGNTIQTQNYTFSDKGLTAGNYTYRLKQVDFDGSVNFSKAVEVEVSSPNVFALTQNYPNPFNPSTSISFTVSKNELATLKVFNSVGQEVATLFNSVAQAGNVYEINFDARQLSTGIYFYQLRQGSNLETKKMILIK
jgi:hypothetical protein